MSPPTKIEVSIYVGALAWSDVEAWKDVAPPPVHLQFGDERFLGNVTEIDQDPETKEIWHLTIENIRSV